LLDSSHESLKRIAQGEHVRSVLEQSVLTPVNDLLSRPCKEVRSQLTVLGFLLSGREEVTLSEEQKKVLTACGKLIELLHAGSLVVDDIQDNSEIRRGQPSLHLRYGTPLALNAGNWLYFFAFEPLKQENLAADKMLSIYQAVQETLLAAHYGQALDLSTRIDELSPQNMQDLSMASLRLKTGALMSLAIELGAIVAGASLERRELLKKFGSDLGVSLQMFDDIGNLKPQKPTIKHLEDLALRRPSFVWAYLSQPANQHLLVGFKASLQALPEIAALQTFLKENQLLENMWRQSWQNFEEIMAGLQKSLGENQLPTAITQVYQLGKRIAHAY
jgi:geranylgeranyl pyrophosphate synthase